MGAEEKPSSEVIFLCRPEDVDVVYVDFSRVETARKVIEALEWLTPGRRVGRVGLSISQSMSREMPMYAGHFGVSERIRHACNACGCDGEHVTGGPCGG